MTRHSGTCIYPQEPCSCYVGCEHHRRTTHERWCQYPSEPCSCGLDKARRGECK